MSSKFYPNGIGGTLGDQLDTCKPLITSGNVWYVSSLTGTDAASPAGQNREKPLATIAQAVTNAVASDIIVCLSGHTESLTTAQSFAKALTVIGEGTVSGKPGVQFRSNSASNQVFTVTASNVVFRNLYFPEAAQANGGIKVSLGNTFNRVVGCYFDCGAKDTGTALVAAADSVRVETTTFISTATLRTAQPAYALRATGGSVNNLELTSVVVSAGTVGFQNPAVDLSGAGSMTSLNILGMSLLLGADMDLPATWTGWVNTQLATGGSRVTAP